MHGGPELVRRSRFHYDHHRQSGMLFRGVALTKFQVVGPVGSPFLDMFIFLFRGDVADVAVESVYFPRGL